MDRALATLGFADRALTAFSPSDQHRKRFSVLYKESSKYVLDDIRLTFTESLPADLSNQTRNKLIEARCRYLEGLYAISRLTPESLNAQLSSASIRILKNGISEVYSFPSPSTAWDKLHEVFMKSHLDKGQIAALQSRLDAKVEKWLGPFEQGMYDESDNWYMYIEH